MRADRFIQIMIRTAGLLAFVILVVGSGVTQAKEYRIGPEDVLDVRFWQDENLSATVRVGQDGKISLDIIGQIDAAGKTAEELQDDIVRQISRINKNISQCVVRVQAYNYNYVFVNGQVKQPGKRAFEQIPDIWTVINEAGGVTETGDLTQVTIIRGSEQAGKVEVVNVSAAVAAGKADGLPKIQRGDAINVPATIGGLKGQDITQQTERKNIVYVLGSVKNPGPVNFEDNTDILELLALAGGPLTSADLKKLRVVTRDGNYAQTLQFDLNRYTSSGKPARYILRKEDALVVPDKGPGFLGSGAFTVVTATVGVITSLILVINQVKK
jgi:polysaccharide biosynthesis/export protein